MQRRVRRGVAAAPQPGAEQTLFTGGRRRIDGIACVPDRQYLRGGAPRGATAERVLGTESPSRSGPSERRGALAERHPSAAQAGPLTRAARREAGAALVAADALDALTRPRGNTKDAARRLADGDGNVCFHGPFGHAPHQGMIDSFSRNTGIYADQDIGKGEPVRRRPTSWLLRASAPSRLSTHCDRRCRRQSGDDVGRAGDGGRPTAGARLVRDARGLRADGGATTWLVMEAPSIQHFGQRINSVFSGGWAAANCEYRVNHRKGLVTVWTTRQVAKGSELLAYYGDGYVLGLRPRVQAEREEHHRERLEHLAAHARDARGRITAKGLWRTCDACGCRRLKVDDGLRRHRNICKALRLAQEGRRR